MSEKHTPEPWFVAKGSDGYRYIVDGSGFAIADGLFEADAEYIVERMNACSGQTTEDLKLATAHKNACIEWECEMMRAIGEDGVVSVSDAIAELKSQLSSANARLDLAVKALEKFIILNPNHYKDIAGLINNATDTLTQIKEA